MSKENDRTTILVHQDTRKRLRRIAGKKDATYEEVVNEALDELEK